MRKIASFCGLLLLALPALGPAQETAPAALPRTASPNGAMVYFLTPADGATVTSPVTVRFGLRGMGVAPAGVTTANTGHHHLLIDVTELPPDNLPIPNDATHRHFGAGQTETELTLDAWQAHSAARARRRGAYPASAAGAVGEDHDHRGREVSVALSLDAWTSATTSSTPSATHR